MQRKEPGRGRKKNLKHDRDAHALEQTALLNGMGEAPNEYFSKELPRSEHKWIVSWNVIAYHCLSFLMELFTLLSSYEETDSPDEFMALIHKTAKSNGASLVCSEALGFQHFL